VLFSVVVLFSVMMLLKGYERADVGSVAGQ